MQCAPITLTYVRCKGGRRPDTIAKFSLARRKGQLQIAGCQQIDRQKPEDIARAYALMNAQAAQQAHRHCQREEREAFVLISRGRLLGGFALANGR